MKREMSQKMIRILMCPACRGDIKHDKARGELCCAKCRERYRINNGVPVFVQGKAKVI